jgi:hypothetical protein
MKYNILTILLSMVLFYLSYRYDKKYHQWKRGSGKIPEIERYKLLSGLWKVAICLLAALILIDLIIYL